MDRGEISARLNGILTKQLSVSLDKVTPTAVITSELGADSLDIAEIAMMIRDEFGYDMSDAEVQSIKTVHDIIELIEKKTNGSA